MLDPFPKKAKKEDRRVIDLCKSITKDIEPFYLNTEQENDSLLMECTENVYKKIKSEGGTVQYGWQIWETLSGVLIEAEFHAVWVDLNGCMHDITPKEYGIDSILFLPDNYIKYNNEQIDNKRISLVEDPVVDRFIKNSEEYFLASNEEELKYKTGIIIPTPRMISLLKEKEELILLILNKYFGLK